MTRLAARLISITNARPQSHTTKFSKILIQILNSHSCKLSKLRFSPSVLTSHKVTPCPETLELFARSTVPSYYLLIPSNQLKAPSYISQQIQVRSTPRPQSPISRTIPRPLPLISPSPSHIPPQKPQSIVSISTSSDALFLIS